jgi:hypothetical protein
MMEAWSGMMDEWRPSNVVFFRKYWGKFGKNKCAVWGGKFINSNF